MVKSRNTNTSLMGTVSGTMASQGRPERVRTVTTKRHFLEEKARIYPSEQVLSSTQSPYPVGSQFNAGTLLWDMTDLGPNAVEWIQSYDKFRILDVEVFATLTTNFPDEPRNIPVELYFYEDTDADNNTQTSWIRVRDRRNIGKVVLNSFTPSMRIAKFSPTVSFAASGTNSQDPSNMIPKKNQWLDALATEQRHSGLRFFSACPTTDSSGASYKYTINLMTRITVEATQPI